MTVHFEVDQPAPETCAAVIANGPSLKGVDLLQLPPVATFGMNAAYRHWERIGWGPTHYACLDEVVGLSHADAIAAMINNAARGRPSKFLLRGNLIRHLGTLAEVPYVVDFDQLAACSRAFGRCPVTTGSHTLIWALSLGFQTVFLLGADCSYVEMVRGAERVGGNVLEIVRAEDNPNYFFDDYQRIGDRYNVPNIVGEVHLNSWRAAAAVAAEGGAVVYNLSPDSRIDAFDFVHLDDWLSGRRLTVIPREERAVRSVAQSP